MIGILIGALAWAVPLQMTQQGRVVDSSGVPFDGIQTFEYRIYDAETGVAACVFYISGLWRSIVVDDRLPARHSTQFPGRYYPIYGSRP